MRVSILWTPPEVNPISKKARSVPALNPLDKYGRTFFFSTMGFMIAFMSWYAWTPLVSFILYFLLVYWALCTFSVVNEARALVV